MARRITRLQIIFLIIVFIVVFGICQRFYSTWSNANRKKPPPVVIVTAEDTEKERMKELEQKAKQQIAVSGEKIKLKKKEGYDVTPALVVLKDAKNFYDIGDYKNAIFYADEVSEMLATLKQISIYTYTVKRGDCLWNISKKHYNKGSKWYDIWKTNKKNIKDFDVIYRGQKFIIPDFSRQDQS